MFDLASAGEQGSSEARTELRYPAPRIAEGKIRSMGSGMRHGSVAAAEVTDDFSGVFTPSMRAGRSRLRRRSKGLTAPGILLQYPTPRFPRTSISSIVLPKSSSSTTVTSQN